MMAISLRLLNDKVFMDVYSWIYNYVQAILKIFHFVRLLFRDKSFL